MNVQTAESRYPTFFPVLRERMLKSGKIKVLFQALPRDEKLALYKRTPSVKPRAGMKSHQLDAFADAHFAQLTPFFRQDRPFFDLLSAWYRARSKKAKLAKDPQVAGQPGPEDPTAPISEDELLPLPETPTWQDLLEICFWATLRDIDFPEHLHERIAATVVDAEAQVPKAFLQPLLETIRVETIAREIAGFQTLPERMFEELRKIIKSPREVNDFQAVYDLLVEGSPVPQEHQPFSAALLGHAEKSLRGWAERVDKTVRQKHNTLARSIKPEELPEGLTVPAPGTELEELLIWYGAHGGSLTKHWESLRANLVRQGPPARWDELPTLLSRLLPPAERLDRSVLETETEEARKRLATPDGHAEWEGFKVLIALGKVLLPDLAIPEGLEPRPILERNLTHFFVENLYRGVYSLAPLPAGNTREETPAPPLKGNDPDPGSPVESAATNAIPTPDPATPPPVSPAGTSGEATATVDPPADSEAEETAPIVVDPPMAPAAQEMALETAPPDRPEPGSDSGKAPSAEVPGKAPSVPGQPVLAVALETEGSLGVDRPIPELADLAMQAQGEARAATLRDLVLKLLAEDRPALAYHLSCCLETLFPGLRPRIVPPVLKLAVVSRHLRTDSGELAEHLQNHLGTVDPTTWFWPTFPAWNRGMAWLSGSLALLPALLAPRTSVAFLLRGIPNGNEMPAFRELCEAVADFSGSGIPLPAGSLRKITDLATWQANLDHLRQECETWWGNARGFMAQAYIHGRNVWRRWIDRGEVIDALLAPIRQGTFAQVAAVQARVDQLADEANLARLIQTTDQQIRPRGANSGPIQAGARNALLRHANEALLFARRWVELLQGKPGSQRNFHDQRVELVQQAVARLQRPVEQELAAWQQENGLLGLAVGRMAGQALNDLFRLFHGEFEREALEPPVCRLLHQPLLLTSARLADDWSQEEVFWGVPVPEQASRILERARVVEGELLQVLAGWPEDYAKAFQRRSDEGDHLGTSQILEVLEADPATRAEATDKRGYRDSQVRLLRQKLAEKIERVRLEVEEALAMGILQEADRNRFDGQLVALQVENSNQLRFDLAERALKGISEKIGTLWDNQVQELTRRLEEVVPEKGNPVRERVTQALAQRDLLTATEFLNRLANGGTIGETEAGPQRPSFFREVFPDRLETVSQLLGKDGNQVWRNLGSDLRNYAKGKTHAHSIRLIDLKGVGGPQAGKAADMMEAWLRLKQMNAVDLDSLATIATVLGFGNPSFTRLESTSDENAWLNLRCVPLKNRETCPIPAFGSLARGHYKVLCVWKRPSVDHLLDGLIGHRYGTDPIIVFYFGRQPEQRRRELALKCRARRRSVVVLDDPMILLLCQAKDAESRLRQMFELALPFSYAEPYITSGGVLLTEMFYGREHERQAIIEPTGSCFIYGGRQLGKTALLRDVEMTAHDHRNNRFAKLFDLKLERLGLDRGISEIWPLLTREFKGWGIFPTSVGENVSETKFRDLVCRWLQEHPDGRILLLLDEADRFLESDGTQGYKVTTALKGVMEATNRRFKVVFAGLHNVQRTTRQSNHPLAHFGVPCCIGPLLENNEWRAARALIETPLSTLGYEFEEKNLPMRILSQTNYFPSLIQLYCAQLLRHLLELHRQEGGAGAGAQPPFVITAKHLREAYLNKELRREIRDKFRLTLDLDPRYRVIALTIALYSLPEGTETPRQSFSVAWIRGKVLDFWANGFQAASGEDTIRALLDEMVGLGVLRMTEEGEFALRSPNVLLLLGTAKEIEDELVACSDIPASEPFEMETFRPVLTHPDLPGKSVRSPLTARQEADLTGRDNRVGIVFGTEAAGLAHLRYAFDEGNRMQILPLAEGCDRGRFQRDLKSLPERTREGVNLVMVSPLCPWTFDWLQDAKARLENLSSRSKFLRFVFQSDPATTWRLVTESPGWRQSLDKMNAFTTTVRPWSKAVLKLFLVDADIPATTQTEIDEIYLATGGWAGLIQRFLEACPPSRGNWRKGLEDLQKSLIDPGVRSGLLRDFGLDDQDREGVLKPLADIGSATGEDLAQLIELPLEMVSSVLQWADLLGLLDRGPANHWRLNTPALETLLRGGTS